VKIGDLVRLRQEVFGRHGVTPNNPLFDAPAAMKKAHGIITDKNPHFYFVKWFNCPVYGSEGNLAHKQSDLEVISAGR